MQEANLSLRERGKRWNQTTFRRNCFDNAYCLYVSDVRERKNDVVNVVTRNATAEYHVVVYSRGSFFKKFTEVSELRKYIGESNKDVRT